jgi:seryl-tRNA(Sec) selenium transferase
MIKKNELDMALKESEFQEKINAFEEQSMKLTGNIDSMIV